MASVSEVVSADWPAPEFPALEAPAPWVLDATTALGAWGVFIHLAVAVEPTAARLIARELLGDELAVYANEDMLTETTLVWRLEFSVESAAAQFESRVRQRVSLVVRDGTRVVVAHSTGSSSLDWAF
jgi:hypothetical protein